MNINDPQNSISHIKNIQELLSRPVPKLDEAQLIENIKEIKLLFAPKVLERQYKIINKRLNGKLTPAEILSDYKGFNPLAGYLYAAEHYKEERFKRSDAVYRINTLAEDINILKNATVKGLDSELTKLTNEKLDSNEELDKIVFEVATAASYARKNNCIEFVAPTANRTPDLIIDKKLEIECKVKDMISRERRTDHEILKSIVLRTNKLMGSKGYNCGIGIQTREYLDQNKANIVVQRFKEFYPLLRIAKDYNNDDIGLWIRFWVLSQNNEIIPATDLEFSWDSEQAKPDWQVQTGEYSDDRRFCKNIRFWTTKSDIKRDLVESLMRSLNKDAAKQFSRSIPAIIFLNTNHSYSNLTEDEKKVLNNRILHFLDEHDFIHGVYLCDYIIHKARLAQIGIFYPNPKHPFKRGSKIDIFKENLE